MTAPAAGKVVETGTDDKWGPVVAIEDASGRGLFAATSLAIIPVIVVYMIFQKQFIAGIATGSGK